ncbi:MAG: hypothetical protein AAF497_04880, partial [Planctomycetota bacterium]
RARKGRIQSMKECVMDAIRRCVTSWRAAGLVLLASGFLACPACAQPDGAMMPEGWRDFEAGQFLPAAKTLYGSTPRPALAHAKEVAVHAWERFLLVETFVTSEEWPVVQGMADLFVPRRNLLLESGWSASRVEAAVSGLRDRMQAYLAGNDDLITRASFDELLSLSNVLDEAGQTDLQRGQAFARWMDENSWRELNLAQQAELLDSLKADVLDFRSMAARWTGQVQSTETSTKRFRILRPYRSNIQYRLWVSGKLVLDSESSAGNSLQYFESEPVSFSAGRALSIKVELVNNYRGPNAFGEGSPMMVLLWAEPDGRTQIVPSSALVPAGQAGSETGLTGEYFNGPSFDVAAVATRVDSSLQSVWTWEPVVAHFPDQLRDLMEEFVQKFNDDSYIAQLSEEERGKLMDTAVGVFTARLELSERLNLFERISGQPQLLRSVTPSSMATLMEAAYMLPGDEHLELLAAWSRALPQPRTRLGVIPGRSSDFRDDFTFADNASPYIQMGRLFQGAYWSDMQPIIESQLRRDDGECDLRLAYVSGFAAFNGRQPQALLSRVDQMISDDSLTGDARMTWALARAFYLSLVGNGQVRPQCRLESLEQAFLVARSSTYRFWALQELVATLGSMGESEKAIELLNQHAVEFTLEEQVNAIRNWRSKIDTFAEYYRNVRLRTDEEQASHSVATHIGVLRSRLASARANGDEGGVDRYQALLAALGAQD